MYPAITPFNTNESFSVSLESGNVFSDRSTQIIGALSWGMRCNIPLDEALRTLRTKNYK